MANQGYKDNLKEAVKERVSSFVIELASDSAPAELFKPTFETTVSSITDGVMGGLLTLLPLLIRQSAYDYSSMIKWNEYHKKEVSNG